MPPLQALSSGWNRLRSTQDGRAPGVCERAPDCSITVVRGAAEHCASRAPPPATLPAVHPNRPSRDLHGCWTEAGCSPPCAKDKILILTGAGVPLCGRKHIPLGPGHGIGVSARCNMAGAAGQGSWLGAAHGCAHAAGRNVCSGYPQEQSAAIPLGTPSPESPRATRCANKLQQGRARASGACRGCLWAHALLCPVPPCRMLNLAGLTLRPNLPRESMVPHTVVATGCRRILGPGERAARGCCFCGCGWGYLLGPAA